MLFTDQTGSSFTLVSRPIRIVSLVPSITELLCDLGLDQEVVGITRFCTHPEHWFKTKTRIGGTKDPRIDRIKALEPDLIIANKEENVESHVIALRESCPVWVSDVNNLDSALDMILRLGELTQTTMKARQHVNEIQNRFNQLAEFIQAKNTVQTKAIYFIWRDPWMVAGPDTFISDMINRCGWINAEEKHRYPTFDGDPSSIDLVLLSSEPYPFGPLHRDELKSIFPKARIQLVDGEFFSWYGSRMKHAPFYFEKLISSL